MLLISYDTWVAGKMAASMERRIYKEGREEAFKDSVTHLLSFQSSEALPLCFPLLSDWSWFSHILS